MKAKTYRAKSIQEALDQIKRELGPDAVILSTQPVTRRRAWGLRRVQDWEITATDCEKAAVKQQPGAEKPHPARIDDRVTLKSADIKRASPDIPEELSISVEAQRPPRVVARLQRNDTRIEELLDEISELKRAVRLIGAAMPGRAGESGGVYGELVSQGIDAELADQLVSKVSHGNPSPTELRDRVRRAIAEVLMIDPPAEFIAKTRIISIFVGPTGAGKTTTIAKIAAHAKARHKKRIALVSTDMFRVGGHEQISRYGDLLGMPTYPCAETASLRDLVDSLNDRDLVLIDTPGASPSDVDRLSKLEDLTGTIEARVHLVVAATTRSEDITNIVKRFHRFRPRRVVITKIDETDPKGAFVADILRNEMPISFLTNGQRVPEDLLTPVAEDLARYLLPPQVVGIGKIPALARTL
jgi:flagellar biosynthesis protein FlhF